MKGGHKDCAVYHVREPRFISTPSSIYSWSVGHILEHEFFRPGRFGSQGSKEKKLDLRNSEQLLRVVFQLLVVKTNI